MYADAHSHQKNNKFYLAKTSLPISRAFPILIFRSSFGRLQILSTKQESRTSSGASLSGKLSCDALIKKSHLTMRNKNWKRFFKHKNFNMSHVTWLTMNHHFKLTQTKYLHLHSVNMTKILSQNFWVRSALDPIR